MTGQPEAGVPPSGEDGAGVPNAEQVAGPSSLVGLPPWPMMADLSVADAWDGRVQCGIDLVEIDRVERAINRWGERFLRRVWTERELVYCRGRYPELAARFAAKEAASKTLGTGLAGIIWRDIEILPDRRGKPLIFLHGRARERAERLGLDAWAVSLTHTRQLACAMVIASISG